MADEVLVHSKQTAPRSTGGSPWSLLEEGALTLETIQEFKRRVFAGAEAFEKIDQEVRALPEGATGAQLVRKALGTWAVGRHEEAVPLLRKLGGSSEVLLCLGRSLTALGRYDEARSVLDAVPSGDPARPAAVALKLSTLEHARDWGALAAAFEKAAGELEGTAWLHYFRGRLAEEEWRREEALAHYEQALSADEDHQESLFRMAYVFDLGGLDDLAIDHYQRCLHSVPANVAALVNLGILYEDAGHYRKAMSLYDLVLRIYPNHHRARLFRRDAQASLHMYFDEDMEKREDKRNQILRIPITDFELSVRSRNCLAKMNIRTLGDLVQKTESELLSYKNFGETSLNEIKEILKSKNLHLGMATEELFGTGDEEPIDDEEDDDEDDDGLDEDTEPSAVMGAGNVMERPIADLDLSVRCRRIMEVLRIRTIGDLCHKTEAELLACPNFGQTSLNEVKSRLEDLGLSLKN